MSKNDAVYAKAQEDIRTMDFSSLPKKTEDASIDLEIDLLIMRDLLSRRKNDDCTGKVVDIQLGRAKTISQVRSVIRALVSVAKIEGLDDLSEDIRKKYISRGIDSTIGDYDELYFQELLTEKNLRVFLKSGDLESAGKCFKYLKQYFNDEPVDFDLLEGYVNGQTPFRKKQKERPKYEISYYEAIKSQFDLGKITNIIYFLINDCKYREAYQTIKLCQKADKRPLVPSYRRLFLEAYKDGDYQLASEVFISFEELLPEDTKKRFQGLLTVVNVKATSTYNELYQIFLQGKIMDRFDEVIQMLKQTITENVRPVTIMIKIFNQLESIGDIEKGLRVCEIMEKLDFDIAEDWKKRIENWGFSQKKGNIHLKYGGKSAESLGIQLEPVNKIAGMGMNRQIK